MICFIDDDKMDVDEPRSTRPVLINDVPELPPKPKPGEFLFYTLSEKLTCFSFILLIEVRNVRKTGLEIIVMRVV